MTRLDQLMDALADSESRIDVPARVEASVLAAWDRAHAATPAPAKPARIISRAVLAAAAVVLLAVAAGVVFTTWPARTPQQRASTRGDTIQAAPPTSPQAPFVEEMPSTRVDRRSGNDGPVPPPDAFGDTPATSMREVADAPAPSAIPRVLRSAGDDARTTMVLLIGESPTPADPLRVVRMRVPRSALSALGLRSVTTARTDSVDLDVLVGEDGVARAVRLGM